MTETPSTPIPSDGLPTDALRGLDGPVTRLSMGTWALGSDAYGTLPSDDAARELLASAWDRGIRSFDLAMLWEAPRLAGLISEIAQRDGDARDELHVSLRVGRSFRNGRPIVEFGADALRRGARTLRETLGDDARISLLLHAPPTPLLQRDGMVQTFLSLRDGGLVNAVGASCVEGSAAVECMERGLDHVALPYNVLQTDAVNELDESFPAASGESPHCVIAHSVLLHGVLAAGVPAGHVYPHGDHRRARWTEEALRTRLYHARALMEVLDRDLERKGISSLEGLALRYALSHPRIGLAVIGPRTEAQLETLLAALGDAAPLPEVKRHEIESRLAIAGA